MFRYSIICLFAEGGCSGFSLCFGLGGRFGCPVLGFVCGCVVFFALFVLWRFDAVCFVVGLDAFDLLFTYLWRLFDGSRDLLSLFG